MPYQKALMCQSIKGLAHAQTRATAAVASLAGDWAFTYRHAQQVEASHTGTLHSAADCLLDVQRPLQALLQHRRQRVPAANVESASLRAIEDWLSTTTIRVRLCDSRR